jgi:signal peptidase I
MYHFEIMQPMTDQPITNQPTDQTVEKERSWWDETIRTLLVAVLLAMIFRSFAFEPFHIPSGSMKPTLLVGDYLFVSKYSYGYSRFSFPLGLPLFKGRVLELSMPQRGEVVVFRPPARPHTDFIKRIVGLPGDTIQVKQGVLYINGQALNEQSVGDFADSEDPSHVVSIPRYSESLPDGKVISILKEHRPQAPELENTGVYVVPAGNYFMMGDNRDHSADSRISIAMGGVDYVPAENIVGRAELIFFSIDGTFEKTNPVSWFTALRLDRFFKIIN